jgi:hypothetical protein
MLNVMVFITVWLVGCVFGALVIMSKILGRLQRREELRELRRRLNGSVSP